MASKIRESSLAQARHLGYPINLNLPEIDAPEAMRSLDEAAGRLLALYAAVSSSFGFSREKALGWLDAEGLSKWLTSEERAFLETDATDSQRNAMQWQVESLWALSWAVGCHGELDFSDSCPDTFIAMLPDLKTGAPAKPFLTKLAMRASSEVLEKCDLAYCLHWGAREASLTAKVIKGAIPDNVIRERRRALEWLIGQDDWYETDLST